jgi:YVTN family beta-propeller protein
MNHRAPSQPGHAVFASLLFSILASTLLMTTLAAENSAAPRAGLLLVANKGARTLSIIDPALGRQIATVPEDAITGHEVAASPDGRLAFVPIYGNSGVGHPGTDGSLIRVIDLAKRAVTHTIDFGKGVRPHCAVINEKTGLLYVTTELENSVTVIDPKTMKIVRSVPTGAAESHMFALSRDGKRGYTANVGPGTVSVLDMDAGKTLAIIPVAKVTQRISLSVDDRWAFTSDQTKPQLAVIDTRTNAVTKWIPLPGIGYGTAPTPDGRWLLAAILKTNQVAVIDLKNMEVARTLDVPRTPQEVLVRPDGLEAYVSCDSSRQVAVIDLGTWHVAKLIDAGAGADGLAWAR